MAERKVVRQEQDTAHLMRLAKEYKDSKELLEKMKKRQDSMRDELIAAVEAHGYTDDKGHQWLKLGDLELKRERRVSRSLDSKTAEAWAKENGFWEKVKEVVEHLSEEKLLALAWEDKSLNDIVAAFYQEKEVWALKA